MPKFDSDTAWPQYKEATRETPDHARNIWVVFVMAFGSGITVMFGAWLIALGAGTDKGTALVLGGVATLVVWFVWLLRSDAVIWTIETVTGHDVNRDGSIGEPQATDAKTWVELPLSRTQRIILELDAPETTIREWCVTAINGGSLSYANWEGRFSLPDGTQGRERYGQFRQQLTDRGLAIEKGGNIGLKLTRTGWLFVEAFAEAEGQPTALLAGNVTE